MNANTSIGTVCNLRRKKTLEIEAIDEATRCRSEPQLHLPLQSTLLCWSQYKGTCCVKKKYKGTCTLYPHGIRGNPQADSNRAAPVRGHCARQPGLKAVPPASETKF
jgi:hypothetical protein